MSFALLRLSLRVFLANWWSCPLIPFSVFFSVFFSFHCSLQNCFNKSCIRCLVPIPLLLRLSISSVITTPNTHDNIPATTNIYNENELTTTTSLLQMQYIIEFGVLNAHRVSTLQLCFREAYEFLGSQFYNLHGFFGVWIGLHYIDGSTKWVDGSMFNDTLEGKVSNGCI